MMATTHIETTQIRELPDALSVDTSAVLAIQAADGYYKLELSHLVALIASDALEDLVLDQVDNTSDLDKPLSTATIAALGDKADLLNGILVEAQRPDILSLHLSESNFPPVGTLKVIYVARDTGVGYYYSSTDGAYVPLTSTNSGSSSDSHEHVQSTPAAVWTVNHDLGRYPSVTTLDSNGAVMIGEVVHDSSKNSCVITFSEAVTGIASAS